jgi:hypothetical protein
MKKKEKTRSRKVRRLLEDLKGLLQHHKMGIEAAALVVTVESTGLLAAPLTHTQGDQNVSVTLIYMPRKPQADA